MSPVLSNMNMEFLETNLLLNILPQIQSARNGSTGFRPKGKAKTKCPKQKNISDIHRELRKVNDPLINYTLAADIR